MNIYTQTLLKILYLSIMFSFNIFSKNIYIHILMEIDIIDIN